MKNIQDVARDARYKRAKSQYKILCILGYTEMTKSNKFRSSEICTIHYIQIYIFVIFV
jgi:50S ribosomal subunit-associated GTPase HflX